MSNVYGFDFLKSDHKDTKSSSNFSSAELSLLDDNNNINSSSLPTSSISIHTIDNDNGSLTATTSTHHQPQLPINVYHSITEKVDAVLQFLKNKRSSGCLQPNLIYSHLGIDLSIGGDDDQVRKRLLSNPYIKVEEEVCK